MPFQLIRADITKLRCDAIVNAANNTLLGGGGVDGAIHSAAGPQLLKECMTLGGCETGDAKITGGYLLPCRYVIHTVGPIWQGGDCGEEARLRSCYLRSLALAEEYHCHSIAFPLISAGVYGYPKAAALDVAADTIRQWLQEHEMTVYLVIFSSDVLKLSEERFSDIRQFIDDHYVEAHTDPIRENQRRNQFAASMSVQSLRPATVSHKKNGVSEALYCDAGMPHESLEQYLNRQDESFSRMLLRLIDERGMKDSDCYKKANIDRKLFSKIRSNEQYKPSKQTAVAFAVALELSLPQTEALLKKAGFALSHSSRFDLIVEYFIQNRNYNIMEINEALFAFDQVLLGS